MIGTGTEYCDKMADVEKNEEVSPKDNEKRLAGQDTEDRNCSTQTPIKEVKSVINLSSRTLNSQELAVLSKGLNFVPTVPQNNVMFFVHVEKGLQQLKPCGAINSLRHQIVNILKKGDAGNAITTDNLNSAEREIVRKLSDDTDITFVPADKDRAVVIMDKSHFQTLTDNILNDNSTYKQLENDPTARLQRKHRALLKRLLKDNEIDSTFHKILLVQHPQPPYARVTIKIHNDDIKARLHICTSNTVHHNTALYLSRLLAPLGKTAKSFIADSSEFCKKISTITEPGKLLSYKVVDLFTNVPREEAFAVIRSRVKDSTLDTNLSPDSIIDLINGCITFTYFTWRDQIMQQTHGLPTGSPLSSLISEIYMTHLEETALDTFPVQPTCWFRKVDDTFVILPPSDDPNVLLQHLNSQHTRMQFTMELEEDNQLPFLDVLVQRDDKKLNTSVYRKPSHTDQYLHFSSFHPIHVKKGKISTLTRRAKNICSTPASLDTELDHLRHVFTNYNEYPATFVNQAIKNTLNPTAKPPQQAAPFTIRLPYIGQTSHHIRRLLKQQANIDVIFQRGITLQNLLQATGRPTPTKEPDPAGVVYQIECDCGKSYIGETKRPLTIRIKEHRAKKSKFPTAVAHHLKDNPNHEIKWDNIKVLERNQADCKIRKLLEAVYIKKIRPAINKQKGSPIHKDYDPLLN
ncbi:uncharacterized protein LOC124254499 isoform X2 [Haliotis rubra]|uniref:uncharacterized protein LOC124254499 isoform X2 n=1 Tax=Haliotis rubra TaxID=36100 RepID=UPI001EE5B037|nr:uncharacterized protein LOC124254499 isoform X2 [Haliotis rubra]